MNYEIAYCNECGHWDRVDDSLTVGAPKPFRPEFCTQCGAKMLYGCQSCGMVRKTMDHKFCPKCGKPYK